MSHATDARGPQGNWRHALALVVVFAVEWAAFQIGAERHAAWIYPRWFDQAQYLRDAYSAFDPVRSGGLAAGLAAALGHVSAQGALHGVFALLAFAVVGPGRGAALAVNLAAFLALQAMTFAVVRRVSGRHALAWAAVGLLAAFRVPWSGDAGSAVDFRLDWMAACLYGVALGAAILADGFRSTRGALALGVAVGIVLLTRYLTAVYFVLIFAGWLPWVLVRKGRIARGARLALAVLAAAALAGWAFWRTRHQIFDYYWMGHFGGPEGALRDAHLSPRQSLAWLLSETLVKQLGPVAGVLAVAATAALAWSSRRGGRAEAPGAAFGGLANPWIPVLLFLAAPAAVLTLHPAKATQPLEILVAPVAWAIVLAWVRLSRTAGGGGPVRVGAAVAVLGFGYFGYAQARDPVPGAMQAQYRDVNALADYLFFRAEEAGISHPRVATTWRLDGVGAEPFEVMSWERHGRRMHFVSAIPVTLFALPAGDVGTFLARSDFVCLVTRAQALWPFDEEMQAMLPGMGRWCDAHMARVAVLDEPEFSMVLYEREGLAWAPAGQESNFAAILAGCRSGPANADSSPPAAPFFPRTEALLLSDRAEMSFTIPAAYSPLRIDAEGLPAGSRLDPASGEVRGFFPRTGEFAFAIRATNPLGSSTGRLSCTVVDSPFDARVEAPAVCGAGERVEIGVQACDASASLNFIDVTDLTAVRVLARMEAGEDERQSWRARCTAAFGTPGRHVVLVRTVRYHVGDADPYSYVDRRVAVDVMAAPPGVAARSADPN